MMQNFVSIPDKSKLIITIHTQLQEDVGDDPSIRSRPSNPPVMVSSTIGDLISEAMEDGEEGLTTSATMASSGLNSIPGRHDYMYMYLHCTCTFNYST